MERERDQRPYISQQVSAQDVELVLSRFTNAGCQDDDCEAQRRAIATSQASYLDLLDEPMVLPQVDAAYRLRLSGTGNLLAVRIERTGQRTTLVTKMARGDRGRQPAVQTIQRRVKLLSESDWRRLEQALDAYGFWGRASLVKPPNPSQLVVMDGVSVSLEGVASGKRQLLQRSFSPAEAGLQEIVRVFRELASCEGWSD